MAEKYLVTNALPYANGPIHLGHLVEFTQTDIYVRWLRMTGREAVYICADDQHGTPIEVNARKAGVAPEEFIAQWYDAHVRDLTAFGIEFSLFYKTHSEENRRWAETFFERLKAGGHVERRPLEQYYCETDKRFLPDRFIKGTCPRCGAADQYGDVCEVCGQTYEPTELKEPRCALCGTPPVRRRTEHFFVKLSRFNDFLLEWTRAKGHLQHSVRSMLTLFFAEGLKDWDITRDGPYFGFRIPGTDDQYFYVWLDAPIGYLSSTEKWAKDHGRDAMEFWAADSSAKLVHFLGKDIVYFHTLFWPAMLKAAGLKLPDRVVVHGHLTVGGEKMSKSRGTFITAETFLGLGLDPDLLRYFYASNLGRDLGDIDLSADEFGARITADLVKNIGNLCNRALTFLKQRFDGKLGGMPAGADPDLFVACARAADEVQTHYEAVDLRMVVQTVRGLAETGNLYMQRAAPWALIKTDPDAAHRAVTLVAHLARALGAMLKPIVPGFVARLEAQLGGAPLGWADARISPREDWLAIGEPKPLVAAPTDAQLAGLRPLPSIIPVVDGKPQIAEPTKPEIAYDDFGKLDLRVGKILSAERVPKADKLLKLSVDLGEPEPRTIAAGIAEAYADPQTLVGKNVVVVANLAPRTIRGITSRGMLLAAHGGAKELGVVEAAADVAPGSKVS